VRSANAEPLSPTWCLPVPIGLSLHFSRHHVSGIPTRLGPPPPERYVLSEASAHTPEVTVQCAIASTQVFDACEPPREPAAPGM
jgi:hypothetical protein